MDSGSGGNRKRRREGVRRRRSRGAKGASSSRRRSSSSVSSSFTPPPMPSRAAIEFKGGPVERPIYRAYLLGFAAVFLIILLGGGHHAPALGLALIVPGVALCVGPPLRSLGSWVDWSVLALLLILLTAFLPLGLVGAESWRVTARETFELSFGGLHSVQPRVSLEAWLLALAGCAWLYVTTSWQINYVGRQRLMCWVCVAVSLLAAGVIWGNLVAVRYPGAEQATAFSYFPNRNQTANFLALAGVASFGYAMEGLRNRNLLHLAGLVASCLCLFALVLGVSRAGVILYFLGIFLWLLFRMGRSQVSPVLKVGMPFVLLVFSVFLASNQRTTERVVSFVAAPADWGEAFRVSLYRDSIEMIEEAPWFGHGLGKFSAVFPQYRDLSRNYQQVRHPESDVFWLATEGGLLALLACFGLVCGYLWLCRGTGRGQSGVPRVTALVAVIVFLLHGFVDVSGHRPGTVYFAILFAALALPRRSGGTQLVRPWVTRSVGCVLVAIGFAWLAGGVLQLPLYSGTAKRVYEQRAEAAVEVGDYAGASAHIDRWMGVRPMDWRAYCRRAQVELASTGNLSAAAASFRRARFLEPILGVVTLEEGYAWLPYDFGRTVSAWRSTLYRELEGQEGIYRQMLREARGRPLLLERMISLSALEPEYRVAVLTWLKGDVLMREIRKELAKDPALSHFTQAGRAAVINRWIQEGDLAAAEAYLHAHGERLEDPWRMWSVLRKNQARFQEAVEIIRKAVPVESIPEVDVGNAPLERMERAFMTTSREVTKGTALLKVYIDREEYDRALKVADRLVDLLNPPAYAYYWRAELLYRLGDYIESWDAFQRYLLRKNR